MSGRNHLLISMFSVAKFATQNLADIALWQAFAEFDFARALVVGETFGTIGFDFVFGQVEVTADNEQFHDFARMLVRYADSSGLHDAWMPGGNFFDFVWIDIEAGNQDHVLLAVDDLGVTAFVHEAHVARAEETIGHDRAFGFIRTFPISLHHLRAAHADFPDLTERQ